MVLSSVKSSEGPGRPGPAPRRETRNRPHRGEKPPEAGQTGRIRPLGERNSVNTALVSVASSLRRCDWPENVTRASRGTDR